MSVAVGSKNATKLESALAHAAAGFSVFPLVPNAKTPAIKNWRNLATTDPVQIGAWWSQWPDANIGISTTPYLVVDIDPRNGGDVTAQALALVEDFPKTRCATTAGGGSHMIYRLPDHVIVRGGAGKLGKGIDIKSWGGLIVGAGSTIDGKSYLWITPKDATEPRPLADAPQWLIDRCKAAKPRTDSAGKRLVAEDPESIERAFQWLAAHAPTAEIGNRGFAAYKVACRLYEFGVTRETCAELIGEWSETRCDPPMDQADVEHAAESAEKNMQNAIGSKHSKASGFEVYEMPISTLASQIDPDCLNRRGLHYVRFAEAAARALTHGAEPLIEGIIDCGAMSIVYGESNTGKSFMEMDKDYHLSSGIDWAGRKVKQGGVMWVAAEGGSGIYKRLAALNKHYERDDVPMFIVPCPVNLLNPAADIKQLIALIKQAEQDSGTKIIKVTLDTLSRVIAGGDENSSVDMGLLVHHFDAIRDHTGAHLAVVHHTGKDKARGARGHSLLRAATDTEIEVADRIMTVTKQRDLEGDVILRFDLRPTPVGTDKRGRVVTSCWVEVRQKSAIPDEPGILSTETSDVADEIADALMVKNKVDEKGLVGQTFRTAFAIECARKVVGNFAHYSDPKSAALKDAVNRMLREMRDNAWIEKLKQGQWVWKFAQLAQDAQK